MMRGVVMMIAALVLSGCWDQRGIGAWYYDCYRNAATDCYPTHADTTGGLDQ